MILIVIVLLLIGLIGCIIPVLPGPLISFIGLLVFHTFTSFSIEIDMLWLLGIIMITITFLDYWLQIYGVEKFGGGRKAVNGTILGLVLGLFLPPFGIIVGPFIGAFIGAKIEAKEDMNRAIKIAFGALA